MKQPERITAKLRAPFPYFGGKSRIASVVWKALGDVKHYMEPFFGSGAVLLARPAYDPLRHIETICELDPFLANVWRALATDYEAVAEHCDWPASHIDLAARRRRMMAQEADLTEKMLDDPEYFDPKLAGWWIWATSCWIGSGMLTRSKRGMENPNVRPHLSNAGNSVVGVRGSFPLLTCAGQGVHSVSARGVESKVPNLINTGFGPHRLALRTEGLFSWFAELQARVRSVRQVCGDWSRICGGNWQALSNLAPCGIFLDPPYSVEDRKAIYAKDDFEVAKKVTEFAIGRGDNPDYRIVVAGYEEHAELLNHGWKVFLWKASGGYGHQAKGLVKQGKFNRGREVLYLSPHCLPVEGESREIEAPKEG